MKSYDNYIFDLYGTLIDIHTDENKKELWDAMAMHYSSQGAAYSGEELQKAYCACVKETEERLQAREDDIVEIEILDVFKSLYEQKGIWPGEDLLEDTAVRFRTLSTERLRLFEGVKETLSALRENAKKVYLLSNAQSAFTIPEMKRLGIYDFFDGIMISSVAGYKKPTGAFFDALFKKYGQDPAKSVMVGNDFYDDILGATDYGMDSAYIDSPQSRSFEGGLPASCTRIKKISDLLEGTGKA